MLGVCMLTASWCIFLPWTTGGDTLESTLPGLIRAALLFFGVWAWGGCALLRCPCGLGRRPVSRAAPKETALYSF